ncbi:MAG TPA: O-acetyl-ADP-ribose deacetylase [Rectinema sp.]|nr:O-acetyl-ADP-ribose deacetylase [Rectinema sp.]HQH95386.1 O-acetyl-ADP-ribose deacetylase [Rectinema sp.]
MKELYRSDDNRCIIAVGDITNIACDAIVNAANSSLLGGGGVDGAIHSAGGPEILAECRELRNSTLPNGLPPGKAVATTAGRLPAKRVIHTVGPIWHGGTHGEDETLASCYRECLALAVRKQLKSIAFPAISTGIYGFPKERAAKIAWNTVQHFLANNPEATSLIVWFVFFSEKDARIFLDANELSRYLSNKVHSSAEPGKRTAV